MGAQGARDKACGVWGALGSTKQALLLLSEGVRKGGGGREQSLQSLQNSWTLEGNEDQGGF